MDQSQQAVYAAAQQAQRIGALEDLLRRNEQSLSAVLSRLKDNEVALNALHRGMSKVGPDLATTVDELHGTKRRMELIDQNWQHKAREYDAIIQNEVRGNKPPPLENQPAFQRLGQEVVNVRGDIQETVSQVRRLTEVASADGKTLRGVEADARWLTEQLRDHIASQKDFAGQQARRNDAMQREVQTVKEDVEDVSNTLRKVIDAVVKATREEMVIRIDAEAKARAALQNDFVQAFARMRDDVIKGFGETAANLKNLDETSHSLETVLRAEVRSRMHTADEMSKRVEVVEERLRREALSAAEYLKALDTQMSGALRDVREVTASECKSQLDSVWRSINDINENVKTSNANRPSAGANDEIAAARTSMQIDAELQRQREEIMQQVEHRIATATAPLPDLASKASVDEMNLKLTLKIQEVERKGVGANSTGGAARVSFDESSIPPSLATNKIKKVETRMDECEKQVVIVAEAVRDVHEELMDKLEKLEAQSAAIDALQKSLQETFDRDQAVVVDQMAGIRTQVVQLMDELEQKGQLDKGGVDEPLPQQQPSDQMDEPQNTDTTTGNEPLSPHSNRAASPSMAFSHKTLDEQIAAVRKQTSELRHEVRRDVAEIRAQQDQLHERHTATGKASREDFLAVRQEITSLSKRVQENDEQLELQIHQLKASGAGAAPAAASTEHAAPGALERRLDAVETDVGELRTSVGTLRSDVTEVQKHMESARNQNSDAQAPLPRESTPPPPASSPPPPPAEDEPQQAGTPAAQSRPQTETPAQREDDGTPPPKTPTPQPEQPTPAATPQPAKEGDSPANTTPAPGSAPAADPAADPPADDPPADDAAAADANADDAPNAANDPPATADDPPANTEL